MRISILSLQDRLSVIKKDWAAGSNQVSEHHEYIFRQKDKESTVCRENLSCEYTTVEYAPAWLKGVVDEPLVNAIDHFVRCYQKTPAKLAGIANVTEIRVTFEQDGRIRIFNNGPGVEVQYHKIAGMYVPQHIFGNLYQGENLEKSTSSITGGTNGLGAKLANCFSTEFIVETVDNNMNKYYVQRWTDHMHKVEDPVIIDLNSAQGKRLPAAKTCSHTTLSMAPDYNGIFKQDITTAYATLHDVILTRVVFASAYVNYVNKIYGNKQQIKIIYNNLLIDINGAADIGALMFPGSKLIYDVIKPNLLSTPVAHTYKYPWEIGVVITDSAQSSGISNINGIVVQKGKHLKHIQNQIVTSVKNSMAKLLSDNDSKFKLSSSIITDHIFIILNSQIPNPSWTGQRKDVFDITDIKLLNGYIVGKEILIAVESAIRDFIIDEVLGKKTTASKTKYEKYHGAKYAHGATGKKCKLLLAEGDSAMNHLFAGISNRIGFDYYGIISLGGVIINARKKCKYIETKSKKHFSSVKNIFFNAFLEVTGLNPKCRYDPNTPTYPAEMKKLKYGGVIAFVDQDLDGIGNIFGLILNMFEYFWPCLLNAGFVTRADTPIKRAYPKAGGKIIEFYTDLEYDKWVSSLHVADSQLILNIASNDTPAALSKYRIKYYKGIGTHERDEIIQIFTNMGKHLYTYYLDEQSHQLFEVYYGIDADLRKDELRRPIMRLSNEIILSQINTLRISCTNYLRTDANYYRKDNLERKLDRAIDGMNQSSRKIYYGSYKVFTGNQ